MNAKKIMKKAADASTVLSVAVAFLNVALLVTELVKTVTSDGSALEAAEEPAAGTVDEPVLE